MITSSAEHGAEISVWSSESPELEPLVASTLLLEKEDLSVAQPMVYQTRDGVQAHAYFYPPRNSSFEATIDSLPPLMVLIHGGPTARVLPLFEPRIQYWTTRGYAVVDVNYRGSSGYGRRYRDALYGRWGERDINDVVDAIHFLVVRELIDPERIVLRGSSAGGYAVLQLLVHYPKLFRAGASYYGIGNLATLASITHKFEKYYTDRLIGEDYDQATANKSSSLYYQRSPIFYLDQLNAPLVLFQGLDDKVVPPSLSKEVVKALEDRGISCQYVEYPNEGHGFRSKKARVDALERETRFFSEILFSA
jgi:dipeptidyl aminopeptidase/acylaminoacyl peptidase